MTKQPVDQRPRRRFKHVRRALIAALTGTIVTAATVASPSDAARFVDSPDADCGWSQILVDPGLQKNQYKTSDKYYYVVDLQRYTRTGWKNVDRFPKQGWGLAETGQVPVIPTAYLDGHYRVEATFVWFEDSTQRYEYWTSTNSDAEEVRHYGPYRGRNSNSYCTY